MKPCLPLFVLLCCPLGLFGQTVATLELSGIPLESSDYGIRGNAFPLSWDKSVPLTKTDEGYTVTLTFPEETNEVEFKFVYRTNDQVVWEGIDNRKLVLPGAGQISEQFNWSQEQVIDITKLGLLEPAALLADFELIETMVREVHPGTYRYNDAASIDAALEKLRKTFSQPQSYQQAYLAISELTAALKCDHTKAGFNNQGPIINAILHYQADKLPFTFAWVEDQMIVIYNASENPNLKRGSKVLKVNGVDVATIRDEIVRHIGADGATDSNRLYKAQINGYDFRYNAFDIFFPLLYPFQGNEVSLELQPLGGDEPVLLKVSTLTREERARRLTERFPEFPATRDDLWRFKIVGDRIGVLTMNSFGLRGWKAMTLDYKQFLADAFDTLQTQGIKHLILDIRENNGGNDEMADELFGYLAETKAPSMREGRTRYVKFPASLKPYVQSWGEEPWYFQLNPESPTPTDGYYIFKDNFATSEEKSDKPIYEGSCYLLTGPANTSLAFYTALRFQEQELGTIVGRETGGNLNDINGGQILFLRLPNSEIEIDFPVMGGFAPSPQPNTGVQPDVRTVYKVEDVAQGRDLEMEAVLSLIDRESL